MKKKIIFGAPKYFYLHKMMIKNLENSGFEVFSIAMDEDFKYKNGLERAKNFFYKKIFKNKTYKRRVLYYNYKQNKIEPILSVFDEDTFDYALIVRPDIYPSKILNSLNKISKMTIAYQWDGVDRFYGTKERIPIFDKFFVFDPLDFNKYKNIYKNIYVTNNFYSNFEPEVSAEKTDIYYLGAKQEGRITQLKQILSFIDLKKYKLNIFILNRKVIKLTDPTIQFITYPISYEQNLSYVKNTKTLIDIKIPEHDGLSFRFYECIKYQIKIITTNKTIRDYSFYNPNNIFIVGIDNNNNISDFINSNYSPIAKAVYDSYSFQNWISNLTA